MNPNLTIAMYHFVRDFSRTRFPGIKGLDVLKFRSQLKWLVSKYQCVDLIEVADLVDAKRIHEIPKNAFSLTFDDGYLDHYTYVMPVLDELGLKASFFPVGDAVLNRRMLRVNKIHFILACVSDLQPIVEVLDGAARKFFGEEKFLEIKSLHWQRNRFDDAPVNYVKRMLQKALPDEMADQLAGEFFTKFVTSDEAAFAEELYLTKEQLMFMARQGMTIGSHTWSHKWLGDIDSESVRSELSASAAFVKSIPAKSDRLVICYPYGSQNPEVVRAARSLGYTVGVTTVPATVTVTSDTDLMLLSRLDTNDLGFAP